MCNRFRGKARRSACMKFSNVVPSSQHPAPPTLYLGISGVLHPSQSTYELVMGRSPWGDGHAEFENVGVLEQALEKWPAVRVVLTSTLPWANGLDAVLTRFGGKIAPRVAGFTFEDLTRVVRRRVRTARGIDREVGFSSEDYWRMNKSEIVAAHVAWSRPQHWVVIDDEDILWPEDIRRRRLVLTDGCEGLQGIVVKERLMRVFETNFGMPAATTTA